jgi:hypothetical protein
MSRAVEVRKKEVSPQKNPMEARVEAIVEKLLAVIILFLFYFNLFIRFRIVHPMKAFIVMLHLKNICSFVTV